MQSISKHFFMMKQVITSPKIFYEGISLDEGYKKSMIFLLINTFLTMFVAFLFSLVFSSIPQQFVYGLVGIVIAFPLILGLFFIWTVILHLIAKVLRGKGRFVNSFQASAYASGVSPLTAIPIVGFLASFYQVYVTIVGFRKVHQYSTIKAVINILLPIVIIIFVIGVAIAVAGVAVINLLKGTGISPADLKNLPKVQNVEDVQKLYPTFAPDYSYPTGYEDYQESDYYTE